MPVQAVETKTTLVHVGDNAPAFTVTTTDNTKISTEQLKGKVIMITFFATSCGPCQLELPHLETDLWRKFKDQGLVAVAIGREHNTAQLAKFKSDKKLTIPMAADPKREIYKKYATEYIPRNFVIGRAGKVVFESVGFEEAKLKQMIEVIQAELDKAK